MKMLKDLELHQLVLVLCEFAYRILDPRGQVPGSLEL